MEALPDLGTLSDAQLRQMIRDLEREENEVSYHRRMLQGKIDILRAELVARLQRAVGEGQSALTDVDLERLSEILAAKAPPPEEGEEE